MVAGNISGEATTLVGNILTEAMAFSRSSCVLVFWYGAAKTLSRDTAAARSPDCRGNILKSKRERMRGPNNRISRPVVERLSKLLTLRRSSILQCKMLESKFGGEN
jgi:hypothetical protein